MGQYDIAQICLNGHVVNSGVQDHPEHSAEFCDKCGQPTIVECPSCNEPIRGFYYSMGVAPYYAPSYCHKCGKPYPWTERSITAASELADELEGISDEEIKKLKESLPDLLQEGPRTKIAESRFKKIMVKAGKESYEAMKSILINIVSESVKRSLFG